MPQFKAQCVFPYYTNGKLPVVSNKVVVSDGDARCSPNLVGLDNLAGSSLQENHDQNYPLLNSVSCEYYLCRNLIRVHASFSNLANGSPMFSFLQESSGI